MTMLAKLSEIRVRLGVPADVTIDTALLSALESATLYLESILKTGFEAGSYVDDFKIPRPGTGVDLNEPVFRLANGFVDQSGTVVAVKLAYSRADMASAPVADADFYRVNEEKGLVRLSSGFFAEYVIPSVGTYESLEMLYRVEYDAGFQTTTVANEGDYYTGVPGWLKEAALVMAMELYAHGQNCTKDDVDKAAGCGLVRQMISNKIRVYPNAVTALT